MSTSGEPGPDPRSHPRRRTPELAGPVRPEEGVPPRRETRDRLLRERGAGRAGGRHPQPDGVEGDDGEDREACEQRLTLQVGGRAHGADDDDADHRQEEADEPAPRVDEVADECADGPPVGWAEVLVAVLGRRPAPHRSAGSCRSRGPGSRPRRAAPRIPATHQGAPMAVDRWRRWAAIRTGALTSP